MKLEDLDYWAPAFSQPEAVRLTNVTAATLDNWLRFGHVQPVQNESRQRRFSFADLLTVDALQMLADPEMFKIAPVTAAGFARRAAEQYFPGFERDRAEIVRGVSPWSATRDLDAHFSFVREDGKVRELEDGEEHPNSVMLVLPTRMLARRLMSVIASTNIERADA